jgi:hypothetical protein
LTVARGLAGLGFEAAVQAGGVTSQLGHVDGLAQLADESGRVPGGAAGELFALEQYHIANAELAQVVGHGHTDDAAADNDHARA